MSFKEIIKNFDLNAKKFLGQNFIFDGNITNKIVSYAGEIENNFILEIGPGPGRLTYSILEKNPEKLFVIEKDRAFIPILKKISEEFPDKLEIIHGDALNIVGDFTRNKKLKIIANLPYNIATELLIRILKSKHKVEKMIVMLQKEVAERIIAQKGNKKYGRLSVIFQLLAHNKYVMNINPLIFRPIPKVQSSIIEIVPKKEFDISIEDFSYINKVIFSKKRKMIKSNLKIINNNAENLLREIKIDPNLRAENLALEEIKLITKSFCKNKFIDQ